MSPVQETPFWQLLISELIINNFIKKTAALGLLTLSVSKWIDSKQSNRSVYPL